MHTQGEICNKYAGDLKERVRMLLNKEDTDNLKKLELVDSVQRLGVGYHFKNEITRILEAVNNNDKWDGKDNLHATSLKFRLLRQHYFKVPQGEFMIYSVVSMHAVLNCHIHVNR